MNALTKASNLLNIISKEKVIIRTIKKTCFIVPKVANLCFPELSGTKFGERALTSEAKSPKPNLPTIDVSEQFQRIVS